MEVPRLCARGCVAALMTAAIGAGVFAGCGSSDESSATSQGTSSAGATATAAGDDAAMARAKAAIAPYVGKPGPFPVSTPLSKIPTGAKVAWVDPGTPFAAVLFDLAQGAAKTMGMDLYRVKAAGGTAEAINAAFNTVAEQHPDAVIDAGIDPELFQGGLRQLKAAGIPIVSTGVSDPEKWDFAGGVTSGPWVDLEARLLADYVYAQHGQDANVAFYYTPDLSFAPVMKDAFVKELGQMCPDCEVRAVPMPAATIGNTMPSKIVSDLQAHPDTKTAVSSSTEMFMGLPAAMKAAGIEGVETTGSSGAPANLQMIKDGQQTSALFVDFPVSTWTLVDMAARAINGEPVPADEGKGIPPLQFLEQKDITFDPAKGWTGYPDFAQRFSKLWGVGADQ